MTINYVVKVMLDIWLSKKKKHNFEEDYPRKIFLMYSFEFPSGFREETNRIGSVMVSVPASCVVDRGFNPRSGQAKYYKIVICCFSAKYATVRLGPESWCQYQFTPVFVILCLEVWSVSKGVVG